nr:putative holin [uncultured bacterium]
MNTNYWLISSISAIVFFLFGNDPRNIQWLQILLLIMAFDLMIWTINLFIAKKFCRDIFYTEFVKKFGVLAMVAISHQVDKMTIANGYINIQSLVTGFFIGYEGLSVLDQLSIMGLPIPKALKDIVRKHVGD